MKGTMITSGIMALSFSAILLFAGASANMENASDAKSIFVTNKCNTCHSITAQGIAKINASSKASDLSGAGLTHNAAWFQQFLNKETSLNGKQHAIKFKGSAADLTTLATWLGQQKKK